VCSRPRPAGGDGCRDGGSRAYRHYLLEHPRGAWPPPAGGDAGNVDDLDALRGEMAGMLPWVPFASREIGPAPSLGSDAQRPVQQPGITKPAPQLTLQAGDRVEILRRPGVLVLQRGIPAQRRLAQVRQPGHLGSRQVRRALDADDAGPGRAGTARQPQVPRVALPGGAHEKHRRALAASERAHHRVQFGRQVGAAVALDEADRARKVRPVAQWAVDDKQIAVLGGAVAGELGAGGRWPRPAPAWRDGAGVRRRA